MQQLTNHWEELTFTVLDKKGIPFSVLQALLTETYAALLPHHQTPLVPKETVALFLEMENFLYFAFLMEEKEMGPNFFHAALVKRVVDALKEGFFRGNYGEPFPKIAITHHQDQKQTVNLETDDLEKILR